MRANLTKHDGEYSITTAHRAGGTRRPRTTTVALTDCVCYDAEGNVIRTIARTAKPNTKARSRTPRATTVTSAARRDIMLQATMGTIHSEQ
jgi:hypothetical protein